MNDDAGPAAFLSTARGQFIVSEAMRLAHIADAERLPPAAVLVGTDRGVSLIARALRRAWPIMQDRRRHLDADTAIWLLEYHPRLRGARDDDGADARPLIQAEPEAVEDAPLPATIDELDDEPPARPAAPARSKPRGKKRRSKAGSARG